MMRLLSQNGDTDGSSPGPGQLMPQHEESTT